MTKEFEIKTVGQAKLVLGDSILYIGSMPNDSVDLVITSPPYFMGKDYDKSLRIEDFIEIHNNLLPEIARIVKPGGSICWQVGNHVRGGVLTPLDVPIFNIMSSIGGIFLRNRIVWTFGHGLHARTRFSGRYETVMWFTKGSEYFFDLDSVRVPQKYPGKKSYKGNNIGNFSGNPLGKNPADVWEIPNVKARHLEKSDHPCQFPIALCQRLIRALSPMNGMIFDPFMGAGSAGAAALIENRQFLGVEIERDYYDISEKRCIMADEGLLRYRPLDKPIYMPDPKSSLARTPNEFLRSHNHHGE